MGTTVRTVVAAGPADPEVAWQRFVQLDQWAEWAPQISGVEASADQLGLGVTGTVRAAGGLPVPFVVTSLDLAARRWSWIVRPLGLVLSLNHTVDPDLAGTRTTLAVEGPTPVVTAYAPLAYLALRRLVG